MTSAVSKNVYESSQSIDVSDICSMNLSWQWKQLIAVVCGLSCVNQNDTIMLMSFILLHFCQVYKRFAFAVSTAALAFFYYINIHLYSFVT